MKNLIKSPLNRPKIFLNRLSIHNWKFYKGTKDLTINCHKLVAIYISASFCYLIKLLEITLKHNKKVNKLYAIDLCFTDHTHWKESSLISLNVEENRTRIKDN